MAMLFESAQSAGLNMEMVFLSQNLHLLRIGQDYNSGLIQALDEESKNICITRQIPSYLLGIVLNELFEFGTVDCTAGSEPETFTCTDSLFKLISSEEYMKTSFERKLDNALNTFGEFISHDLSINVQEMMLDDDLMNEFEDIQYESDDFTKLIKHMISNDCLEFRIYYTEDLTLVLETLIELKEVLLEIKEELNGKNHTNAA